MSQTEHLPSIEDIIFHLRTICKSDTERHDYVTKNIGTLSKALNPYLASGCKPANVIALFKRHLYILAEELAIIIANAVATRRVGVNKRHQLSA